MTDIQDRVREIRATWNALWDTRATQEDLAYLGYQINQLAEQLGLNEVTSDDDSKEGR